MGGGKRRSYRFLCFRVSAGAVVGDDEETEPCGDRSGGGDVNCKASRRCRRRLLSRFFSRFQSRSAEDGSQKQLDIRSMSTALSLPEKLLSGSFHRSPNDDDVRMSEHIFTSSASSSSSTSSSSLSSTSSRVSSISASPIMAQELPTIHRKKPPTPTPTPTPTPSRKLVPSQVRRKYNPTTGLCILLVSLSVLVFSGKLCAILWTSTCLCLTPRRSGGSKMVGEPAVPEVRRIGSLEGDKKRIVLEGFLERNRKV